VVHIFPLQGSFTGHEKERIFYFHSEKPASPFLKTILFLWQGLSFEFP
jgi:hypothetical protein